MKTIEIFRRQRIGAFALVGLFLAAGVVAVALDPVGWEDLPGRLSGELLSIEDLEVVDCPEDLDESTPSRVVMQYIENTFYKWSEYDLADGGYCLVMELPERIRMSREEAQILLTASSLWMKTEPAPATASILDPSDPGFDVPVKTRVFDDTGPVPENVIGTDDRTRVGNKTLFPWATICYVENTFPGGSRFRGSGALVGPNMVLTAAHNIYDGIEGGYATGYLIAPAQSQAAQGSSVVRPFGIRRTSDGRISPTYISNEGTNEGFKHDYGAILFDVPFSQVTTYMPVSFDFSPSDAINVAGYPKSVQSETNSLDMWFDAGNVLSVEPRILRYAADTSGGNSGAPVWWFQSGPSPVRRLIAVHAFGSTSNNGGPRLVSQNLALIQQWMQWRPFDDAYEENNGLSTAWYPGRNWEREWLSSISGAGIQRDEDWYRIDVGPNDRRIVVQCLFSDAAGDINIELVNSFGVPLAASNSTTDHEYIFTIVPTAGVYYIRVWFGNGANSYDLWWDATPTFVSEPFTTGQGGWTWFDVSPAFAAPAHGWSGGSLTATEAPGAQIVYGSWESPKDPAVAMHAHFGHVLRARYRMRSSVDGPSCPGFRFRAVTTHVRESSPTRWDPDFSNQDFNSIQEVLYSTLDAFHVPGREPGTVGQTYTVLYYPEQTASLGHDDVIVYFTCDLLDLEGAVENDSGTLFLDRVEIDSFASPAPGSGTPVPAMTYTDFTSWARGVKPIDSAFNGGGLSVDAGPSDISIHVAQGNQWFEAFAVSPAETLTPGRYYRAVFQVASSDSIPGDFGPTVRAGFASSSFVFGTDKQLQGGGLIARFEPAAKPFEVWLAAPTADASGSGLTEPISLRFESWLADSNTGWPFFKKVSGTVTCRQVATEVFDPSLVAPK